MKKCILTIACLAVATNVFAVRQTGQEKYNGRVTSTTEASNTNSVSAKHKELTLKRQWHTMASDLQDAGFSEADFKKIRTAYYNACRRGAAALEVHGN